MFLVFGSESGLFSVHIIRLGVYAVAGAVCAVRSAQCAGRGAALGAGGCGRGAGVLAGELRRAGRGRGRALAEAAAQRLLYQPAQLVAVRLQHHTAQSEGAMKTRRGGEVRVACVCVCHLVYEAELHEVVRERGRGVAAGHGARQLPVHLVVHAQQDRHLNTTPLHL